jgi:hypothetical protein
MMLRTIVCCAALVLGLMLSLKVSAAPACDGAACPTTAPAKPLNIMQFMREQAASTRAAKPRHGNTRTTANARPAPRLAAARPKPATLPVGAAKSFASQPEENVQVVASDEVNAIDRAADTPAETVGAAVIDDPIVQMVDADEFNDIDRKANPLPVSIARNGDAPAHNEQANWSWRQWIWSALGSTLAALTAAVHQLIG